MQQDSNTRTHSICDNTHKTAQAQDNGGIKPHPVAQEPLASDSCWKRESVNGVIPGRTAAFQGRAHTQE